MSESTTIQNRRAQTQVVETNKKYNAFNLKSSPKIFKKLITSLKNVNL